MDRLSLYVASSATFKKPNLTYPFAPGDPDDIVSIELMYRLIGLRAVAYREAAIEDNGTTVETIMDTEMFQEQVMALVVRHMRHSFVRSDACVEHCLAKAGLENAARIMERSVELFNNRDKTPIWSEKTTLAAIIEETKQLLLTDRMGRNEAYRRASDAGLRPQQIWNIVEFTLSQVKMDKRAKQGQNDQGGFKRPRPDDEGTNAERPEMVSNKYRGNRNANVPGRNKNNKNTRQQYANQANQATSYKGNHQQQGR